MQNFAYEDLKYEVKNSKTDKKIPVVDGVHIHSVYNPVKEAESIVLSHEETISTKNRILILGLGFGYHVLEVCLSLKKRFGDDYQVFVLEPNSRVYKDYNEISPIRDFNIEIICSSRVEEIYQNIQLVDFLNSSPGIIPHPASFNLYSDFFKNFMRYEAPQDIRFISNVIQDPLLKSYLSDQKQSSRIDELVNSINYKNKIDHKLDHLLAAFDSIKESKAATTRLGGDHE